MIKDHYKSRLYWSVSVQSHLPLLAPALGLQGPCALLHTLREVQAVVVGAVIQLSQLS